MKVALIVPGSRAGVNSPRYRELFPHLLPMSIAYLGAVLEQDGVEVLGVDQIPRMLSNQELVNFLKSEKVDVAGFSLLTNTVSNVVEIVDLLRKDAPEIKVLMGNQHATIYADDILQEGQADLIVRGEGEITLRDTVRALANGGDLSAVEGLSYRDQDGTVVHNPARSIIEDLDSIPYPAWHLFDIFDQKYMNLPLIGVYSTPLPIAASRGCPFHCVFCSQDQSFKKVRIRDTVKVVDEVEELVDKYGFEWFGFNDAYFPWTKEMGFQFADELIRRGLHKRVRWITESRVDMVDAELMAKLRESGLEVIFFGFESGNQAVLDRIGKKTTLAQAEIAAKAARDAGVTTMGFFMIGLPGDTKESCWDTVNFAIKLDCDFAKFAITIPYPGSKLFEETKDSIDSSQFEKFTSWYNWASGDDELLSAPDGMSVQELLSIQRSGMFKFYARPSQVYRHLRRGTIPFRQMAYGAYILAEGMPKNVVGSVKGLLGR